MAQSKVEVREAFERLWEDHESAGGRGVPPAVHEVLSSAFAKIPVSSFPDVPSGKVIEISSDATIAEAVTVLSTNNIFSAPVRNPNNDDATSTWDSRYIGMVDFAAVILWVLDQAELAAAAISAGTAAIAGIGAGTVGALGAVALGLTGPVAVAGLTTAAVGAALAGGFAADKGAGKDAQTAADALGDQFYHVILREEPFKSTKVSEITRSYRWAPFLPVQPHDSMLTVLVLMSKFRIRCVPVVEVDKADIKNVITQSAVVRGLCHCQGRDWFDSMAQKTLYKLGLPLMTADKVVSVESDRLVLEAFVLMREKEIGGLPVVENNKIVGNISVRDIRFLLLNSNLFARRHDLTVMEFIKTVSAWAAPEHNRPLLTPPVVCQETDKLGDVIRTLAQKRIHRIYVVDDANLVIGVITLRDIISLFVGETQTVDAQVQPQGH